MTTATLQKWEGRWEQFIGKAKKLWGVLMDDELRQAEGEYEYAIGLIKERTGESGEEIERKLNA